MPVVHEENIEGLTTFWVEAPPPLVAILSFRVGVWDESVLNRGITHLVEHLGLHALRGKEHSFNASVDGNTLSFFCSGSELQVTEFYQALAWQLRSLPVERLETEAGVLSAEAEGRGTDARSELLALLFGPNGPGLMPYPERGFHLVGPRETQAWADRHCVLQNAVLMLTAPPPAGLHIDLPQGAYKPFILPADDLGCRPRRIELLARRDDGICIGSLANRSTDVVMGWQILTERLTEHLRHQLGLIYEVAWSYMALDSETAFLYAGVGPTRDNLEKTAVRFMSVIDELRDKGPTPGELSKIRRMHPKVDEVDAAAMALAELQRVGSGRLLAFPWYTYEQLLEERLAATPETVGTAFEAATDCAAIMGPLLEELGLPVRDKPGCEPLKGKLFRPRRRYNGDLNRLRVGSEGVSGRSGKNWINFRWEDIVLAEHPGPSAWLLMHRNGTWMTLECNGWWWKGKLARLLENGVPRAVRLPRPRGA